MNSTPIRRQSSPHELRQRFNVGRYWQRAEAGEFQQVLKRDNHPSLEGSNEPFCTRSQIVTYRDAQDQTVAVVHQYLRPTGDLGGSGQPDPKMLIEGESAYFVVEPVGTDRSS